MFSPEKKDAITYEDKFLRERYQPSVTQFGGKPVDGWIAVTASGLVSERPLYSPMTVTLQKMCIKCQLLLLLHEYIEQDSFDLEHRNGQNSYDETRF